MISNGQQQPTIYQGLKGVLIRAPGLWAKKCRAQGLQDKNFRAPGLHIICIRAPAPLWSTILRYKNYFATLHQVPK